MPTARFFFDAGSGVALWAASEDQGEWGYAIEVDRLPVSRDLRDVLNGLIARYDTSLNWNYPPDPGPWREAECQDFNEAVSRALDRLRAELGPEWRVFDEFYPLHEDPDLDRYLADPAGFVRA
ncbi:hypothetical protein ACQEVS_29435 [Streptomyces sp. CA-181903]|uniref:hypothetical protein n=1 Tax=Streptomyces sp. CA-181903 TaxID=3240055 RepID=UPI003D93B4E6